MPHSVPLAPVKVLVVDDSRTIRDTLAKLLRGPDYAVRLAEDGRIALARYAEERPDLILLDMNMPNLDGMGVISQVRGQHQDQETQIIVFTSEESPALKLEAFQAGANDFLHKSFDRAELLARVAAGARQVRLTRGLRQAAETIAAELDTVARLQARLLPASTPEAAGLTVKSLWRPSGRASGDYYDHFPLPGGAVRVVVADVSGHGARAAFLMGMVRTLFRVGGARALSLAETVTLLNTHLTEVLGREPDFVTLLAADLDLRRGRMTYLNAGHPPGMLRTPDGRTHELGATSPVLGFFPLSQAPRSLDMPPGSDLLLYTDGVFDWEDAAGRMFDLEDFWSLAANLPRGEDFLDRLMAEVEARKSPGDGFRDDLTALWLGLAPAGPRAPRPAPDAGCPDSAGTREYLLRCPAAPASARRLARAATGLAGESLADPALLSDLDLVLAEACANVAEHAYPGGPAGDLEIRLRLIPGQRVEMEVADFGPGFSLDPALLSPPQPEAASGRGLFIMARLMDSLALRREGNRNVLALARQAPPDSWKPCA